jgi:hypothetical protein
MKNRLHKICSEINSEKKVLYHLLQEKGTIDQEIVNLAQQIDSLIAEYDQLLLSKDN